LLNIVRAVMALANGVGMATTAAEAETEQQLAVMRSGGCTEMQGFLFSRPLQADEVERLLLAGEAPTQESQSAA
jgi:EAL domain-containing protein (putative c-di-GMP-specific phosphodiesterase class I)